MSATISSRCPFRSHEVPAENVVATVESMFAESVKSLQPSVSIESAEVIAVSKLIFHSMTTSGRVYHSMQHVFDIAKNMDDPILILSALFHDVIYYSIDKAFTDDQMANLQGILVPGAEQLTLESEFDDDLIGMVVRLYGFTPGAPLPALGTNEFLSGVIGVRVLSKWLSFPQLMQIAACIEATIPFRPVVEGKSPMDRLYDRLKSVCPDQSEDWLESTVRQAAATANFDLCSFDSTDRDFFLDTSWKLLPEARPILLRDDCPLIEWLNELKALEGRTMFLRGAVPRIFQSFRQVPSDEEMAEKQRRTHENFDAISEYVKVRKLQAMVLVGVVEAMGEDPASFPLRSCLSMDVPELTDGPRDHLTSQETEVRNWLGGGRAGFTWDPAVSPLGAYLFDILGMKGVEEAIEIGNKQQSGSHELLKYLPKAVLVTITATLGKIFTDRADLFSKVPEMLGIMAQ